MKTPTAYVVSDDSAVRDSLKELVESAGLRAEAFPTFQAFFEAIVLESRSCLVIDAHIDDLRNRESRAKLAAACARMPGLLDPDGKDEV